MWVPKRERKKGGLCHPISSASTSLPSWNILSYFFIFFCSSSTESFIFLERPAKTESTLSLSDKNRPNEKKKVANIWSRETHTALRRPTKKNGKKYHFFFCFPFSSRKCFIRKRRGGREKGRRVEIKDAACLHNSGLRSWTNKPPHQLPFYLFGS